MPEILLRFVEGAGVALYRHEPSQSAELLPTRGDLHAYTGGYTWGYGSAGAMNLSFAIVGKVFEFKGLSKPEFTRRARALLDKVISKLDPQSEHDLTVDALKQFFE